VFQYDDHRHADETRTFGRNRNTSSRSDRRTPLAILPMQRLAPLAAPSDYWGGAAARGNCRRTELSHSLQCSGLQNSLEKLHSDFPATTIFLCTPSYQ
jgi:hypothetical protein